MPELVSFFFLLLSVSLLYFGTAQDSTKSWNSTSGKTKRESMTKYLIFPEGSNVQLVSCLTIGTYSTPPGMGTFGVTAGVAWPLPDRNTAPRGNEAEVYHRRSRRELYRRVELMLKT
ncbi:hypothetical protein KM043_007926 [Ampulex compressa]|nr:hypothetical protein KM043_007926 [Ampulex compressa]